MKQTSVTSMRLLPLSVAMLPTDRFPDPYVYIGRPSKWGNPFSIGKHGTRTDVIGMFREWIAENPALLEALPELKGKTLVCWCHPLACHGDVLAELADS